MRVLVRRKTAFFFSGAFVDGKLECDVMNHVFPALLDVTCVPYLCPK
jgi:hypothetical protein